ncbi:2060_t:CDS:2 [Ambispora gerdemannii]|uniref:2060_t:CDS:1 n=1 Tax=Ambispora gerdemannii TaxID=144530 RepID=A0A9N8WD00_9GLOM|nr:2060_t:CDS:2 [Ambispora gerdemannii]
MRPDQHKDANSRRYQAKLRARDGEASAAAKEVQEKRKERKSKSKGTTYVESSEDNSDSNEETTFAKQRSFHRRKVQSNDYRYQEPSQEDELRDDPDGIDRETSNFLEMIKDTEKQSFDPSSYFQFKEEKDWGTTSTTEERDLDKARRSIMIKNLI